MCQQPLLYQQHCQRGWTAASARPGGQRCVFACVMLVVRVFFAMIYTSSSNRAAAAATAALRVSSTGGWCHDTTLCAAAGDSMAQLQHNDLELCIRFVVLVRLDSSVFECACSE